jgi:hypothetical protein
MSCVNDDELGGFRHAQITGKPGATAGGDAARP